METQVNPGTRFHECVDSPASIVANRNLRMVPESVFHSNLLLMIVPVLKTGFIQLGDALFLEKQS